MTRADLEKAAKVAAWVCDRLDESQLPYAIGGALAISVWGVPRGTTDVDVSVFVPQSRINDVTDALERAGALIDRRDSERQLARSDMIVARVMATRVDVFVGRHPLYEEMASRRELVTDPLGTPRYFLSKEDIATLKLLYHRPKDIMDLERLFAVQKANLDVDYIRGWLVKIVEGGDPRLETLADLERRFIPSS